MDKRKSFFERIKDVEEEISKDERDPYINSSPNIEEDENKIISEISDPDFKVCTNFNRLQFSILFSYLEDAIVKILGRKELKPKTSAME